MSTHKPVIGILGGISSGKSTVAAEFAKLGCAVIDADAIVAVLLERQDVRDRIVRSFGKEICTQEGFIDRARLADIVFEGRRSVARINEIIHPLVFDRTIELIGEYTKRSEVSAIVLDIPLLAEAGQIDLCDVLVFVEAGAETRAERAAKRSGWDADQLKKRENFQISLDRKAQMAHYIVRNNSDLSVLADQVARIFSTLKQQK
ncbi:MAG: dephospho-CoA kinase [Phycisphaerae bacterium]|nr:dephospho-CoA kinase [Phycisphaerae bacterium]